MRERKQTVTPARLRRAALPPAILVRPETTIAMEQEIVGPAFSFSYEERNRLFYSQGEAGKAAYDTRLLEQYRYRHAWIAGWWDSYDGWWPYQFGMPLNMTYPFHHPWCMAAHYADRVGKHSQRKPLPGGWWGFEASNNEPTMDIPDLWQHLPGGVTVAEVPEDLLDQAEAIPASVYAGLSSRSREDSISYWKEDFSLYLEEMLEDETVAIESLWDALVAFKWGIATGEVARPRTGTPRRR